MNSAAKLENFKIITPSLLAMLLFCVAIFGVALPASRENLLNQKRLMLVELVHTVCSTMAHYDAQVRAGKISLAEAKELAKEQVRELHYGPDNKNYYWINDMQPRMVMHPYRPELENQDLSAFSDASGKHLFTEIVQVALKEGSGFVPYMWQLNDEPLHIDAKLSYVKLFQPWGWVIGTGIYLDDVYAEIAEISKKLLYISLAILLFIGCISFFIIQQRLKDVRRRRLAETEVENYRQNLENLVRERTEELRMAQSKIKILKGFLPICAKCKKIRDDKGYWNQIESYIRAHSEADFSHGICPVCAKELYPGMDISRFFSAESTGKQP
ncbi:MAG: cache domain-containing protein [Deltaproteobacteria bacterium]|nr:cache domain-containing protein [Deltaproteobacteria bacterium]